MSELFNLKDGRMLILKPVEPIDYEAIQVYLEQLATETVFTNQYVGKPRPTEESFKKSIASDFLMVAWDRDKVAGFLSVHPHRPTHPWFNQTCSFGCHMLQPYYHQGLGHRFMEILEDWARMYHMHRIEGEVRHLNFPAISLYLKHGFLIEGMKKECACIDGVWHHEYMVAKILKP